MATWRKPLHLGMLARWTAVHRHVHLSLIHRGLESPHALRRNRLCWSIRHSLLIWRHLSRISVMLFRSSLLSGYAKNKTICRTTAIIPDIPELRLRSDSRFLVIPIRIMSMDWQWLHTSIEMLRRHPWHLWMSL
jgi:hypothetical protein